MRRVFRRTFLIIGTIIVVLGYGAMFLSAVNTRGSSLSVSSDKR